MCAAKHVNSRDLKVCEMSAFSQFHKLLSQVSSAAISTQDSSQYDHLVFSHHGVCDIIHGQGTGKAMACSCHTKQFGSQQYDSCVFAADSMIQNEGKAVCNFVGGITGNMLALIPAMGQIGMMMMQYKMMTTQAVVTTVATNAPVVVAATPILFNPYVVAGVAATGVGIAAYYNYCIA